MADEQQLSEVTRRIPFAAPVERGNIFGLLRTPNDRADRPAGIVEERVSRYPRPTAVSVNEWVNAQHFRVINGSEEKRAVEPRSGIRERKNLHKVFFVPEVRAAV